MIEIEDLLNRPYLPGRCIGAVRSVLHRRFPTFHDREIPDTAEEAGLWLRDPNMRWHEVGKSYHFAGRDGDLIYGVWDYSAYVAVVVDAVGRIGLTATPERGVHAFPLRVLEGVRSVQRRSS